MLFVSLSLVLENADKIVFIKLSILDLVIKLLFLQGGISNIKYLIFSPIPYRIKLILFIISPLFSFINIFSLLGLFYDDIYFVFISIINSFLVYFLKIDLKNIYRYVVFYTALYFFWINDYKVFLILLLLCFIVLEFHINKKYLKINRL